MVYYDTIKTIDNFLGYFPNVNKLPMKSKNKIKYYNIPCTFDIETCSAYKNNITGKFISSKEMAKMKENDPKNDFSEWTPKCWMYIWQMSINDHIIIGRTWEEYLIVMNKIYKHFQLETNRMIMIFVRNLAFEFQFIKKLFNWEKIFASERHKIIYGITSNNFEFRCSYFLSGCSLETTGKNLTKYKAEKKVGDLNYDLLRNSKTPLTNEELDYCLYDVIVDSNFIKESMELEKGSSLLKMPLTKTGYVRRHCRNACIRGMNKYDYIRIVKNFSLDEERYYLLKEAFAGGFTHANALNSGIIRTNVYSMDFTSSYPAVMCLEQFPISKGFNVNLKDSKHFAYCLKKYCCLMIAEFTNIRRKYDAPDNIISYSKCHKSKNVEEDNGRVVSADSITIAINEVDFRCIRAFYDYDKLSIIKLVCYRKGYLPYPLIKCILDLYSDKTTLKDVIGKEVEYQLKKGMLNSCFGMCVTDPIHEDVIYDEDTGEWDSSLEDIQEATRIYTESKNRFLAYEWGVWTTSYARKNLYTALLELKDDYIYSDTDSVKFTNYEKHKEYFEKYNNVVFEKIKAVCVNYSKEGLNEKLFSPKTIKGKVKTIGLWDFDGHYARFKTLGAKRYLVEYAEDDEHYNKEMPYNLTVSGINKKKALPYLVDKSKKLGLSIFEMFDDDMFVSGEYCGKQCVKYLEDEIDEDITDYLGNTARVINYSGVHLENSPYSLTITTKYLNYINGLREIAKKAIL